MESLMNGLKSLFDIDEDSGFSSCDELKSAEESMSAVIDTIPGSNGVRLRLLERSPSTLSTTSDGWQLEVIPYISELHTSLSESALDDMCRKSQVLTTRVMIDQSPDMH